MHRVRILGLGVAVMACLLATGLVPAAWGGEGPYVGWTIYPYTGYNLGDGSGSLQTAPELINLAPGLTPSAISQGNSNGEVIASNGRLFTWGYYPGDGSSTESLTPHQLELPGGALPVAISAGPAGNQPGSDSVIGSDHKLYSWGLANYGSIGDGTIEGVQLTPKVIPIAAGVSPVAISNGCESGLAIGSDGLLYGWGSDGAFGFGTPHYEPTLIEANHGTEEFRNLEPFSPRAISSGCDMSAAIGPEGGLYTWGIETEGSLGTGVETDGHGGSETYPKEISLGSGVTALAVSSGTNLSAAIGSDNKVYSWGVFQDVPTVVSLPAGVTPTAIAAGATFALALGSDHKIYKWESPPYEATAITPPPGFTPSALVASFSNAFLLGGASVSGGGKLTLKLTGLYGHVADKVSGTHWAIHGDTSVTLYQCVTTYYTSSSCDQNNHVTATLGTGTEAGKFTKVPIKLDVEPIGYHADSCGVLGSSPCYIVAVGNTGDSTASAPLGFALPSATVYKSTEVANGYKDAVKAKHFPIGDQILAQECDSSVNPATNAATNCDHATEIHGTVATSGAVKFSPTGVTMKDGSSYVESGSGSCPAGGTCSVVVSDENNPGAYAVVPIGLAP
jgi:hypothetical protein